MTTLPATFVEADVRDFARRCIEWLRSNPKGFFHPDATTNYAQSMMVAWTQQHPFLADDILYFAEHGSQEAHEALCELAALYTHHNEEAKAPPAVKTYAIRVLRGKPRKHGPGKANNFMRDVGIMWLIAEMKDQFPFLAVHKNPGSHRPTHSSIAAGELTEAGIVSMGFKGVEKVWDRYLPVLAGTRYAFGTRFAEGIPAGYRRLFD
jgi:hypothetical protein